MRRAGLPLLESLSSTPALLHLWESRSGNESEETQDRYAEALRSSAD